MKAFAKLLALLLLSILPSPLFAEYEETFIWKPSGEVLAYRYQLDGEDEEGWTVLPPTVTSIDLVLSGEHTFYLQQSPDGENWSESSSIRTAEKPLEVEEEGEGVEKERRWALSFLWGTGSTASSSGYDFTSFILELSADVENMDSNRFLGFDLRVDTGIWFTFKRGNDFKHYFSPLSNLFSASDYYYSLYADIEGGVNISLLDACLYVAAGPRLVLDFDYGRRASDYGTASSGSFVIPSSTLAFRWGATTDLGVRFHFAGPFSAGAEFSYTYLFDESKAHYIDYKLHITAVF